MPWTSTVCAFTSKIMLSPTVKIDLKEACVGFLFSVYACVLTLKADGTQFYTHYTVDTTTISTRVQICGSCMMCYDYEPKAFCTVNCHLRLLHETPASSEWLHTPNSPMGSCVQSISALSLPEQPTFFSSIGPLPWPK